MSGKSVKRARAQARLAMAESEAAAQALEYKIDDWIGTFQSFPFWLRIGLAIKVITRNNSPLRRRVMFVLFIMALILSGFAIGFHSFSLLMPEIS